MLATVRDVTTRVSRLLEVGGDVSPGAFHRELGEILYRGCGVERSEASLTEARREVIKTPERFWREVSVPGSGENVNQTLEKAGRVADFLDLAELMIVDALDRRESAGAHFRSEYQVDGEAKRDDRNWAFASAWQSARDSSGRLSFIRHCEPLTFTAVPLATRSYA